MGKKMYVGVDGKARKVKKAYIGIDNKARKVKKMYMGVDGKARCIFSGLGELSFYGSPTGLSYSRYNLAGASNDNYALFAGGQVDSTTRDGTVDTYDSSLVKGTATRLSESKSDIAATSFCGNAYFFGGTINDYGYESLKGVPEMMDTPPIQK